MAQLNSNSAPEVGSIHRSIRGTEYIVTGTYAPTAKEAGSKKIERLLLQDVQNSSIIPLTVLQMAAQKKGVQYD